MDRNKYRDKGRGYNDPDLIGRTKRALREKRARFARDHREDSDAQLLEHLRRGAEELGRTPYPEELVAGLYIRERFGGWAAALAAAGLPGPERALRPLKEREIFQREYRLQSALPRQERESAPQGGETSNDEEEYP